ncbi:FAD-dependent oxidoreductase [Phormidesmis priestleyi]
MQILETDVLVVGGGTGGTAAAIQSARRGAKTILVSEFPWLGGMLTSAGVSAPDGNELLAFQTGIWGAFLQELQQRQPEGLDNAWVSFFTYDPQIGAQIFSDWVAELSNLQWISGQVPLEVLQQNDRKEISTSADRITGIRFQNLTIFAKIILDGTELGDLLALGDVPHRWGWELQSEWGEPSAPISSSYPPGVASSYPPGVASSYPPGAASSYPPGVAPNSLTQQYPIQAPTWVVVLQEFAEAAPKIPPPPNYNPEKFVGAWDNHGAESFLNYGRLPGNRFMINWPIRGNDYGEGVERLIGSAEERSQFHQEALWHTQGFAHFIQSQLGRRYGLAENIFPDASRGQESSTYTSLLTPHSSPGGAYALHPYYRESRRLVGLVTVREQDILPKGQVAPLPLVTIAQGCEFAENLCQAIAIGNYANDHHYPSGDIPLAPKSIRWGGRWTGTPFTLPYGCLVPEKTDGLLVCEKNISVSHIANGATRLQPIVLGIGQAAGMAAALCIEQNCQPRELSVRSLQEALLQDPIAPAAVIPLFNLPPNHPDWLKWQRYYLNSPESYSNTGDCPISSSYPQGVASSYPQAPYSSPLTPHSSLLFSGIFHRHADQDYTLTLDPPSGKPYKLVTLDAEIDRQLKNQVSGKLLKLMGKINHTKSWLLIKALV